MNNKRTYYTNGIHEVRLFDYEEIPEGYTKGRVKSSATTTGKKKYNNGTNEAFFFEGTQPEGYVLGRLPNIINSEKANKTKLNKEYHHYNNGIKELTLCKYDEIPNGFVRGRLPMTKEQKKKLSESHKGLKRSAETQEKINYTLKQNRKLEQFDSTDEHVIYDYLVNKYGIDDVEYHYFDDRYVNKNGVHFECDFYVKSEDLFIEYNKFPNHYIEPFDSSNVNHIALLEQCKNNPKNFIDKQLVTV